MRKRRVCLVNEGVRTGGESESWNCQRVQHVSRKVRGGRELGCDAPPRDEKGLGVNLGGVDDQGGVEEKIIGGEVKEPKGQDAGGRSAPG